jgi:hypothetical protein
VAVLDRRRPDDEDAGGHVAVHGVVRSLWAPGVDEQGLIGSDDVFLVGRFDVERPLQNVEDLYLFVVVVVAQGRLLPR